MPEKTIAQKLRENLAALRSQGAPRERIEQELVAAQQAMNARSAADPERQRGALDTVEGLGQAAGDAATFGALGFADDALSSLGGGFEGYGERLAANRDLRKERREATRGAHPYAAAGAEITGALLNPVSRVLGPAKAGAGVLRTMGKGALEGASQGVLQQFGSNVGTTDNPTGTNDLGAAGGMGFALGGVMSGIGKAIPVGRVVRKAMKADDLDVAAVKIRDVINKADDAAYGAVKAEARATPSTPALEAVVADPDLAVVMNPINASRKYRNASAATKVQIAYKLLSRMQGRMGKQMEGSPEFLADVQLKAEDIPILKAKLVKAATGRSQSVVPAVPAQTQTTVRELFDPQFVPENGGFPAMVRGAEEASQPLRTAAEIRAARKAMSAGERGEAWAARETGEAVKAQEGMSAGWETQPQGSMRKSMDRADVERGLAKEQAPAVDPDASPYADEGKFAFPEGTAPRRTAHDATREALEDFRARLGGQASREGRAAEGAPWQTARPYPKGKDDSARRWEQTFGPNQTPQVQVPQGEGGSFQWGEPIQRIKRTEVVVPRQPAQTVTHEGALPSWPKAIEQHATLKTQEDAFRRGADMAHNVVWGSSGKADKLLKNSKAIWKEEIAKMSKEEAMKALEGVLGRLRQGPDEARIPISRTGTFMTTFRSAQAPVRLRPFIELLEAQAGIPKGSATVADKGAGFAGRLSGLWTGN